MNLVERAEKHERERRAESQRLYGHPGAAMATHPAFDWQGEALRLEAQLQGAVEALRDAIAAVNGPVRHMPSPTYTPQISVLRVEEWKKALTTAGGQ